MASAEAHDRNLADQKKKKKKMLQSPNSSITRQKMEGVDGVEDTADLIGIWMTSSVSSDAVNG